MKQLSLLIGMALALSACNSDQIFSRKAPEYEIPVASYGATEGFGSGGVHTVRLGETLYKIAQSYQLPIRELIDTNGLTPPYRLTPGDRLKLPPPVQYQVRTGDSVPLVARLFSVSQHEIVALNRLNAPYQLNVGQTLRLPRPEKTATAEVEVAFLNDIPRPQSKPGSAPPSAVAQMIASASGSPAPLDTPQILGTLTRPAPGMQEKPGVLGVLRFPADKGPMVVPVSQPAPQLAAAAPNKAAETSVPEPDLFRTLANMPARGGGRFLKPVPGPVLSGYGPKQGGLYNEGINISAPRGTPVRAAENGVVVYVGNRVSGYGNLILVKHADQYVTAYAHLDKSLVKKGQKIQRGQSIGTVGSTGNVEKAQLHFEVRKGQKSVDPQRLI